MNAFPPIWDQKDGDCAGPLVFAPHWYDGLTLINKHWNSWFNVDYIGFLRGMYSSIAFAVKFGESAIKNAFQSQLRMLRLEGQEALGLFSNYFSLAYILTDSFECLMLGGYPTVFGEIGIPFDLDSKAAYSTGDYSAQISALDANMCALERDLLSFTLWNYTSDNCHEWGDQWNGEDLSLYSPLPPPHDEEKEEGKGIEYLNRGARACNAFVRPFPIATPGTPKQMSFDLKEGVFTYAFTHSLTPDGKWDLAAHGLCSTACEIYLPQIHYGTLVQDVDVWVSGGQAAILPDHQRVVWTCGCQVTESSPTGPGFSSSPVSDDEVSQTSDAPLTSGASRRKVGDSIIAHKIVIQRRRNRGDDACQGETGPFIRKDGAVIALEMDRDDSGGICPSACCIS